MEESAFGRVVSVLVSPTKTFESIRQRPTWLVALVVLIGISIVAGAMVSAKIDWAQMARDSIASQGRQMSEEQMEQTIDMMEKFGPIGTYIGPFFIVIALLLSAVIAMVTLKLLGGELTFGQSFSTIVHASMPQVVKGLLSIPVILGKSDFSYLDVRSNSVLKSILGAFAPEETGPAMLALLSSVDLFGIWGLVLTAIGLAAVGKVSKGTGALTAVGIWVFWILIGVGLAALGSLGS